MCKLTGLTTLKPLEKTQRSSSWHVPWPARCSNNAATLCETLQSVFNRTTGHLSRLPSPPTEPEILQLTTEEVCVFTRKVTVHIQFQLCWLFVYKHQAQEHKTWDVPVFHHHCCHQTVWPELWPLPSDLSSVSECWWYVWAAGAPPAATVWTPAADWQTPAQVQEVNMWHHHTPAQVKEKCVCVHVCVYLR